MPVEIPAAILGAGALSAGASIFGASKAASAQTAAAQQAIAAQQGMFNVAQQGLNPFIQGGQSAFAALQGLTGTGAGGNPLTAPLTTPFGSAPGGQMGALAQTPGYQFTLHQGELAAQNAFAAQGLGSSGAAGKGLVNYAEGLAGTTFQQQFQNYLSQNAQIANILQGQVGTGAQAAGALGGIATNTGANLGQQYTNIGSAQAAGYNAIGAGVTNAVNTGLGGYLFSQSPQQQYYAGLNAQNAGNPLSAVSNPLATSPYVSSQNYGLGAYQPFGIA